MNYSPKSLPKIDSVEIVSLKNIDADRASEYMQEAYDAPFVKINDELAQQIGDLWRKLPSSIILNKSGNLYIADTQNDRIRWLID